MTSAKAPISVRILARYLATGGFVFVVTTALMALFSGPLGVPDQPAIVLAYAGGMTLHFTINRQVVFVGPDGYAQRLNRQLVRYLALSSLTYAGTAVGVAVLPLPTMAAFVLSSFAMTAFVFLGLRAFVFGHRRHLR